MRDEVFRKRKAFTVAEAAGVKPEALSSFIGRDGFFSTIFDFSYADIDIAPGFSYNKRYFFSLKELRNRIFANQLDLQRYGYGAPYLENHDQNRSPNKYLPPSGQNFEGKTTLGMLYFFLRGVPFIYQGQELGMTNYPWKSMDEFNDVSAHDQYKRMIQSGLSEAEALALVAYRSRDNARTPMLWDSTENAGFSAVKPWLPVHPDYTFLNAEAQEKENVSVLKFYKEMIRLRKKHGPLFMYGEFIPRLLEKENIIAYERAYKDEKALVICNFSDKPATVNSCNGILWLGNYRTPGTNPGEEYILAPWEACLIGIELEYT
jgi:glycosidase